MSECLRPSDNQMQTLYPNVTSASDKNALLKILFFREVADDHTFEDLQTTMGRHLAADPPNKPQRLAIPYLVR